MPPWEVFGLMKVLIDKSNGIKQESSKLGHLSKDDLRLRWHIARNSQDHTQLISTFIDFFMDKTSAKKR